MSHRLRDARYFESDKRVDQRTASQRDRDRILYSSAFRRLGGVTQVALSRDEGYLLHNRLTHSLKVAQVGRRLAEYLAPSARATSIDPEVVEAACLAHDLGHPPFGHLAEKELSRLLRKVGVSEGFEGNAQSFRIVVRLSRLGTRVAEGLNLTRATLNAVLKYPWLWVAGTEKWGAYAEERGTFAWVRKFPKIPDRSRTLEAQIMDWADDITYAVHDVEDFYRAGLIPLHEYPRAEKADLVGFCLRIERRWTEVPGRVPLTRVETERAVAATVRAAPFRAPFDGKLYARATLRDWTSSLIGRYVQATKVTGYELVRPRNLEAEIAVLKELTKLHVVEDPALQTQQFGQRRVIRELFWTYFRSLRRGDGSAFPGRVAEEVDGLMVAGVPDEARARFVADLIAGMTEEQAIRTHRRLTGIDLGPLKDPAVS